MSTGYQQTSSGSSNRSANPDQDNFYQLLGIPYTATVAEITRAYRAAVKRAHPDRALPEHRAQAEEITRELNRAYRTLSNATERLAYDRKIKSQVVQDQLMQRYVGGFAGPGIGQDDPFAQRLKRAPTVAERKDRRRSERSALLTMLSAFLVLTLGVIGLMLLWAILSYAARALL